MLLKISVLIVFLVSSCSAQFCFGNCGTGGGGTPASPDLSIQYNCGGAFCGLGLSYDKTVLNATTFFGSGLNDCTYSGVATSGGVVLVAEIDTPGTPDTIKFSTDGGSTFAPSVNITGAAQLLGFGISITCAATTGHNANDFWQAQTGLLQESPVGSLGVFNLPFAMTGGNLNNPSASDVIRPMVFMVGPDVLNGQLGVSQPHGTGINLQASDNTGTPGNVAVFDANGNVTDGPAGLTQTCTNPVTAVTVVKGIITAISCP